MGFRDLHQIVSMRIDSAHAHQTLQALSPQQPSATTQSRDDDSETQVARSQLSLNDLVAQVRQLPEVSEARIKDASARLHQLAEADAAISAADAIVAQLGRLSSQRGIDIRA